MFIRCLPCFACSLACLAVQRLFFATIQACSLSVLYCSPLFTAVRGRIVARSPPRLPAKIAGMRGGRNCCKPKFETTAKLGRKTDANRRIRVPKQALLHEVAELL
jgi:hypothetical protein